MQLLKRPKEAITAIEECLKEITPSWTSIRSSVLADLAAAYAQRGELDHACALLGESLDLASEAGLGACVRRVAAVRSNLSVEPTSSAVSQLDERLREVL